MVREKDGGYIQLQMKAFSIPHMNELHWSHDCIMVTWYVLNK